MDPLVVNANRSGTSIDVIERVSGSSRLSINSPAMEGRRLAFSINESSNNHSLRIFAKSSSLFPCTRSSHKVGCLMFPSGFHPTRSSPPGVHTWTRYIKRKQRRIAASVLKRLLSVKAVRALFALLALSSDILGIKEVEM